MWSEQEEKELINRVRSGQRMQKICYEMGRNRNSVYAKLKRLGVDIKEVWQ